jgi:hypothetical protein
MYIAAMMATMMRTIVIPAPLFISLCYYYTASVLDPAGPAGGAGKNVKKESPDPAGPLGLIYP